ncbi:type II toxin-antitoxin system VapC family toxin [Ruania suaedae]|uniref:type II toxin-antitoxin system VapC family toxin n=1 Tax=Ruania suaedae TaxID=2897774 RepID=UPI001E50D16C|nr:type II toxin-antitoxin system VapC family toxin [Ruania suaedae]UFU04267.1 type II toxin-antitoxin system VapC family toxin [Ruania suaedae]
MIVDTSALVAVLLGEGDAEAIADALARGPVRISAATLVEARVVLLATVGPEGRRRLDALLQEAEVEVVPTDAAQADIAADAYRDYGKGTGHPAALNLGDCFSYALATARREPLLYKGENFSHTDVRPALPGA